MSTNYYLINKKAWKRYVNQHWFICDCVKEFKDKLSADMYNSSFFTVEERRQIFEVFEQKLDQIEVPAPKLHIGVSYCKDNQTCFMSMIDIDRIQSKDSFWETLMSLCNGKLENYAIIDEYQEVIDWDSFKQLLEK